MGAEPRLERRELELDHARPNWLESLLLREPSDETTCPVEASDLFAVWIDGDPQRCWRVFVNLDLEAPVVVGTV